MNENKQIKPIQSAAILAIFLGAMAFTVVTPAMATLAQHFEGKDVSWISTLPTLFVVIATMISGTIMGKRVKYRTLAIVSSVLSLLGGCAPAFFDSYTGTLICRAIMGFGLGLMAPLGNALIIGLYEGKKQASMLGYGTLFMNAGGIIMQMLGGSLAELGWNKTFYGHAFLVIGLVMSFFLPEPDNVSYQKDTGSDGTKAKVSGSVWVIALVVFIFGMLNYPIMMNLSVLFEARSAGGAAAAGTSLSLYTVAGCAAGLLFGKIFQMAKRWCLSLGYVLSALGALFVYVGQSAAVMTIGLVLIGFGFSVIMPACLSWIGISTAPETIALATSIVMAATNLGSFASSLWLQILKMVTGENLYSAIVAEIIVLFVTAVIFAVYNPFNAVKKDTGTATGAV